MKRVLRFLIRLYPAWWRQRYGGELEALLEDSGSRDVWDIFRGAMQMQMSRASFGRIVTVCGFVGLVVAGIAAFSVPKRYQSTALLKVPAGAEPNVLVDQAAQSALSRNSLVSIVNNQNLYRRERTRLPMEDVVENMRRAIHIIPVRSVATAPNGVAVQFTYGDPSIAQQVTRTLVERFENFEVLDPASLPQKSVIARKNIGLAGLGLGLLFGVVLALILRRRRTRGDSLHVS